MKGYMKAAVLHGVNDLRVEDVLIPEIGDHDVLVKVAACGVCGSDIPRILTQGTYHFPTIPDMNLAERLLKSEARWSLPICISRLPSFL